MTGAFAVAARVYSRYATALAEAGFRAVACDYRGVGFRSLHESIDTTTPAGKVIFHVFAALAEFERDLIRERTMSGLAAARARGRMGGRKPSLSPKKIEVARKMYAAGDSTVAEIAKVLGVSRATIYRHLDDPVVAKQV